MADSPDRDQKTEEATPRRRQEGREKGQVAYSTELVSALSLVAWVAALIFGGGFLASSSGALLAKSLGSLEVWADGTLDVETTAGLFREVGGELIGDLALFMLPVLGLVLVAGYSQVGFQISPKALSVDFARISPMKGFGRLFSARTAMRTVLAMGKILLIATTIVVIARGQFDRILTLESLELGPALEDARDIVLRCVFGALIVIVALAVFDFAFQRFQHERDLRMSKQEIKDENKQSEGDPHLKSRIRQVQREMAMRRMMQDVPEATVVVTNPTHYAVALAYERSDSGAGGRRAFAPKVVAKGVDHLAQRIKQVASEAGVPLYEDVPLARALHAQCEIGDEIPFELYQAVAGVLAYVYRIDGRRDAASARS